MNSKIILCLAVLCLFLAITAIRMGQAAKKADASDPFLPREPLDREFEHECDAPYPRVGE
jgi:hypothetical protein